ncbi:MAG: DUF1684 domain-containing protein [Bifidobacteriaceae bacterium]|jgi:uncharacterized protein (DUF1684 family)|nr:DUF1684 domain-containing protein [Bifidobacteriaceae bacterium]
MAHLPANYLADWRDWHASRRAAAPFLASNVGTHWLGREPIALPNLPGLWHAADAAPSNPKALTATATGLPPDLAIRDKAGNPVAHDAVLELIPGQDLWFGELRARAVERPGAVAVRVFDPSAPAATGLTDIDTFPPDAAWVIEGRFSAATREIDVDHVDGVSLQTEFAGRIEFELGGKPYALAVTPLPEEFLAVFSDPTNGNETAQFRFLTVRKVEDAGSVTIDFNRAYLPPCALSDHYLCPMPPPTNRLDVPVRAGETWPRRH